MPSTPLPAAYALSTLSLLLTTTTTYAHAHDPSLLGRSPGTLRPRAGMSAMTYAGCFSSSSGLTDQGSYQYQTPGYCQPICVGANHAVLGLSGGSDCWCGDALPPASAKVDDSKCNTPCNGYGQQNCGGTNYWSVYLDGLSNDVPNAGASSSSAAASSAAAASSSSSPPASTPTTSDAASSTPAATTAAPSVVTSVAPGHTIVVTEQPAQTTGAKTQSPAPSSGGKSNTAGIAAGVVVGVVAAAAIIGGLVFFLKRRRQQAAEDEYKRSNQVGDFMRGGGNEIKPPQTAYSQMSDSRLDPMVGRRNSSGSIADAQDYSRKILRVANPDGN
ncbi:WSC domain [Recurvomyces mirabilis]|nr:WSC domain [Recurvomyces mirabilis]